MYNPFRRKASSEARKIIDFIDKNHIYKIDSYGKYRRNIIIRSDSISMFFIVEIWNEFRLLSVQIKHNDEIKRFPYTEISDANQIQDRLLVIYDAYIEQRKVDKNVKKTDNKIRFKDFINTILK